MRRPDKDTAGYAELTRAGLAGALKLISELKSIRGGDPLVLAVCDSLRFTVTEADNALGDLLLTDAAPAAPPPVAAKQAGAVPSPTHRHKFDDQGICVTCGKTKSPNGRKAAVPAAPTAEERTLPLPAVPRLVGDAAADRFIDGGQGSSGVRR